MVKIGVYMILNIMNMKVYIGSAVNMNRRKNEHFKQLRSNKHYNKYLQQSFNKYGEDKFKFIEIEETTRENMYEREAYYIVYKDSMNPEKGYNMILPSSDEDYDGSKHSEKIVQIDYLTGEKTNIFNSVAQAARKLEVNEECIRRVLRKQLKSHRNYVYIKLSEYDENNSYKKIKKEPKKRIRISNYIKKGKFKGNPVETFNLQTNEVITVYDNKHDAAEKLSTSYKYINKVIYGERKSFKGMGIRMSPK